MKKVLIITYYWAPNGGSGVQRWLKFVKYLPQNDWQPIVYTPENPEISVIDNSLEDDIPESAEIIKTKIWEPYNFYRNLSIKIKDEKKIGVGFLQEHAKIGRKEKLAIWLRGNFLIPDPKMFWIKPSVNFLSNHIKNNRVDAIITTGPPHSMHMIGLGLKKLFPNIPWIADFRDPWTKIDFYNELNLTKLADKKHKKLEKAVLDNADEIVVVTNGMKLEFGSFAKNNIHLITNGYDESDFICNDNLTLDEKFTISYIGMMNSRQNPKLLWKVLNQLCTEDSTFKADFNLKLIGKIDFSILEDIKNNNLNENLIKIDYLPHKEAIKNQRKSQMLLLIINNNKEGLNILTGKLFEYLAAKRPILVIGPKGAEVENIIKETNSGFFIDYNDEKQLKEVIINSYKLYKNNALKIESKNIEKYSRKSLTSELVKILNKF